MCLISMGSGATSVGVVRAQYGGSWNTNAIQMRHDGNDGVIESQAGDIVLLPSGNVGIGTTSPDGKLTIDAVGPNYVAMKNLSSGLILASGGDYNTTYLSLNPIGSASTYASILAWDNDFGARNLVINPAGGNVGIGTTTPTSKFEVAGEIRSNAGSNLAALWLNNTAVGGKEFRITSFTNGKLYFWDSVGGNRMTIDSSSGNVGIGTTGPARLLHLNKSAGEVSLQLTQGANSWVMAMPAGSSDLRFWDGTDDRLTVKQGGNVGIGTTAPGDLLVSCLTNNFTQLCHSCESRNSEKTRT